MTTDTQTENLLTNELIELLHSAGRMIEIKKERFFFKKVTLPQKCSLSFLEESKFRK